MDGPVDGASGSAEIDLPAPAVDFSGVVFFSLCRDPDPNPSLVSPWGDEETERPAWAFPERGRVGELLSRSVDVPGSLHMCGLFPSIDGLLLLSAVVCLVAEVAVAAALPALAPFFFAARSAIALRSLISSASRKVSCSVGLESSK